MHEADAAARGAAVLTICNACRYCEEYCPVFPAIERRRVFTASDLVQLSNLCHNCGECLYACQYAPPHPFGVNVPRLMAEARRDSYRDAAWPAAAGVLFTNHGAAAALALWIVCSLVAVGLTWTLGDRPVWPSPPGADFYGVVPHGVMVALFGTVGLMVAVLIAVGAGRVWHNGSGPIAVRLTPAVVRRALGDALSLTHLHGPARDCVVGEERSSQARRVFHHVTAYGFLLCFSSTTVAAIYHSVFGWSAPYGWTSLPVILGTAGGCGLLIGPIGLLAHRSKRDPDLGDPQQRGLDEAFITLLVVTSATGLALLAVRESMAMGVVLLVHLGAVMALFVSVPYGKAVHGVYRLLALVRDHAEIEDERRSAGELHREHQTTRV